MARYVALDWEAEKAYLVEARVKHGALQVRQAFAWAEPFPATLEQAEQAGARLKLRLAQAGIATPQVVVCLGRDRAIVREVHYPDVPADEVTAIIRFQAMKELTIPPEEVVLDYAPCNVPWPSGEKRALAVAIRTQVLDCLQRVVKEAGLRLQGVTLRPFGMAAWGPAVATDDAHACAVFLDGVGELWVANGRELLFSRRLSAGTCETGATAALPAALVHDLRRSLAAYASQFPGRPLRAIRVGGDLATTDLERLRQGLSLQVEPLLAPDGLDVSALPEPGWAAFAGALGVLLIWSGKDRHGVNLLSPRQPPIPVNRKKQLIITAAALLLIVGLGLGGAYYKASSDRADQLAGLQAHNTELQKQIKSLGDLDKQLKGINDWANSEMVILDELYDLIARFPDRPGLRITRVTWAPSANPLSAPLAPTPTAPAARTSGAAKTAGPAPRKPIGRLTLEATGESTAVLDQLRQALETSRHWKIDQWDRDTPGPSQARATLEVYRQEPSAYTPRLGIMNYTSPNVPATSGQDRRGTPPPPSSTSRGGQP